MRTILVQTGVAIALLCSCANGKGNGMRAIHVTQCVVQDDRLGIAVKDPQVAVDYLTRVSAQIVDATRQVEVITKRLTTELRGPTPEETATLRDLVALLADLHDLAERLRRCIEAPQNDVQASE